MKHRLLRCGKAFFVAGIFLLVAVVGANNVLARTIAVPGEESTIHNGISAAEDGDVVLVSAGTYYENIDIKKLISVVSESGAGRTVIQGDPDESVVNITHVKAVSNVTAKLSGFTIRGGRSGEGRGGGISIIDADPIIEDNIITSNTSAKDGGGILISQEAHPTIRNNQISYNTATRFGAGIDVVYGSNPLIYDNDIVHNTSSGPTYGTGLAKWGASGAGIYVDENSSPQIIKNNIAANAADFSGGGISLRKGSSSQVEDNDIYSNTATTGAGIHIEAQGGAPQIRNNDIYDNHANVTDTFPHSGLGGGISVYNASRPIIVNNNISNNDASHGGGAMVISENAVATVSGNRIYRNNTWWDTGEWAGGGIYVADSTATITNNVIFENKGGLGGGIALLDNSSTTVVNNTIVDNYAPQWDGDEITHQTGAGIFIKDSILKAKIANNIITRNTGNFQIVEWGNGKSEINNNLINNDSAGIYHYGINSEIFDIVDLNSRPGAGGNVSGDEGFENIGSDDYHIANDSKAVDLGISSNAPRYDIDYNLRPYGSKDDIGAYEYTTSNLSTSPVYRFWSDAKQRHFYTIDQKERDSVFDQFIVNQWKYEGVAYRATKKSDCSGSGIYRFWSDLYQGHFYTAKESERDYVIDNYPDNIWKYEGTRYCANTSQVNGTTPLYRFWSDTKHGHFYTASSAEKAYIEANYPANVWKYERIGFYVYPVL